MDIETAANPADEGTVAASEVVTEELSQQEATTPAEGTGDDAEEPDFSDLAALAEGSGETASPSDELVEVEIDGKKVKVSAEAKDYLLRQQDYTRKTMELAEQRKAVEAAKAEVEQFAGASREQVEAVFAARSAEARVQALLETPIDGLSQDQVNALRLDLADAQRAAAEYSARAQQAAEQARAFQSQQLAKAVEQARSVAAKEIKNLPERLPQLGSLVERLGGDRSAVDQLADPVAIKVLHYADIGMQFLERQRQAGKAKAAQGVQPATQVGSVARAGPKPPEAMSDAEWFAEQQRKAKAKR